MLISVRVTVLIWRFWSGRQMSTLSSEFCTVGTKEAFCFWGSSFQYIDVGAGWAGPVMARLLFQWFNEIHLKIMHTLITAGPLQNSFLRSCSGFTNIHKCIRDKMKCSHYHRCLVNQGSTVMHLDKQGWGLLCTYIHVSDLSSCICQSHRVQLLIQWAPLKGVKVDVPQGYTGNKRVPWYSRPLSYIVQFWSLTVW